MGTHDKLLKLGNDAPFRQKWNTALSLNSGASPHANTEVRRGCGAIAANRAQRYASKRRLPKALWPLIAAAILVSLIFTRQIGAALSWSRAALPSGGNGLHKTARMDKPSTDAEHTSTPTETGGALHGEMQLRYRPSADFQARHIAQMVDFLIRNRGKLDNPVVRQKWNHLDRTSLPLAIYLREIEAVDGWTDLEKEITDAVPPLGKKGGRDMPTSIRRRKVLNLTSEWARRGDELLIRSDFDEPDVAASPDPDGDDKPIGPTKR